MSIPSYGLDVSFIDNTAPGKETALTKLDTGFMTDSVSAMVQELRDTADKLERLDGKCTTCGSRLSAQQCANPRCHAR